MEVKSFTNSYIFSRDVTKLGIGYYKQSFVASWQKFVSFSVGLDRTEHVSFLTGQDRTPKFAEQVLLDRTEFELVFPNILPTQIWCQKLLHQINEQKELLKNLKNNFEKKKSKKN